MSITIMRLNVIRATIIDKKQKKPNAGLIRLLATIFKINAVSNFIRIICLNWFSLINSIKKSFDLDNSVYSCCDILQNRVSVILGWWGHALRQRTLL